MNETRGLHVILKKSKVSQDRPKKDCTKNYTKSLKKLSMSVYVKIGRCFALAMIHTPLSSFSFCSSRL